MRLQIDFPAPFRRRRRRRLPANTAHLLQALKEHGNIQAQWGVSQLIDGLQKDLKTPKDIRDHENELKKMAGALKDDSSSVLKARIYFAIAKLHNEKKGSTSQAFMWARRALEVVKELRSSWNVVSE